MAVGVGQLDPAVCVAELGRTERDQSLHLRGDIRRSCESQGRGSSMRYR